MTRLEDGHAIKLAFLLPTQISLPDGDIWVPPGVYRIIREEDLQEMLRRATLEHARLAGDRRN